MKCKRHPHEHGGGVCASCLRDRLIAVAAARQIPNPSTSPENHHIHLSSDEYSGNRCHRFSLFPSLFRSDESETSSWFSALSHRNKKKINKEKPPAMERVRNYGPSDRGMSPAIDGEVDSDSNASVSGYSTETSSRFRPRATPARSTPDRRGRRHGLGFGFAVCLSPMVRTGHAGRRKNHHPPSDSGFSGELGRNGKPVHFGPNRSRKMADRSRFR